jgi:hypothetical protein
MEPDLSNNIVYENYNINTDKKQNILLISSLFLLQI